MCCVLAVFAEVRRRDQTRSSDQSAGRLEGWPRATAIYGAVGHIDSETICIEMWLSLSNALPSVLRSNNDSHVSPRMMDILVGRIRVIANLTPRCEFV